MRPLHVSINIACVNTFDLRSQTGNPLELATPLVDGSATGRKKRNLHRWTAVTRQLQAGWRDGEGDRRRRAVVQERVRTCLAAS